MTVKSVGCGGSLGIVATKRISTAKATIAWKLRNAVNLVRGWRITLVRLFNMSGAIGALYIRVHKQNGDIVNYGLVSLRVVTTAFVNFVVDQLQAETSIFGDFKYHDSGIGTTAAVVGDTDIETTDGESRVAGTQTESGDNVYETVATIAYSTTKEITEHGVFNASTAGTLIDRHVFSALSVENGDSIEFTYRLTLTAGG